MRAITRPHAITVGYTIPISRTHTPAHSHSPAHATSHTTSRTPLCRVERRAIHTLRRIPSPASLACEGQHLSRSRRHVVKRWAHVRCTSGRGPAQEERGGARETDVVETEVPDGGEGHAEGNDGCAGTDYSAGKDVVPVVEFVDGKSSSDQASTNHGRKEQNHLPERRAVCAHDLELGIKVQRQVDESCKARS